MEDVGASFNRALERFKPNAVAFILGVLIVGVTFAITSGMAVFLPSAILGGGIIATSLGALLSAAISMALWGPLVGGLMTMAGKACMGATPELGDVGIAFTNGRLKDFVVAGAVIQSPSLLGVIPFVGGLIGGLIGMVVSFLCIFTMVMVAEGMDAKSALYQSKAMVLANVKTVVIFCVVSFVLSFAGMIALLVGLLVTSPIVLLILVDTYLGLKNGQPAAGMQPVPQAYPPEGGGYPPQDGGYGPQG
jgi:uncharacterized membrane protein